MRFQFEPEQGKHLVAIEPLSYDRVATAVINENLTAYYVATAARPVQLRIVGPTRVSLANRLNYDVTMKGEQKYTLSVREGDALVKQWPLQTTKSTGLKYEDWKDVVPGKSIDLILQVPEGEHVYKVSLGESVAQSVSLKFSVPKSDLSKAKK